MQSAAPLVLGAFQDQQAAAHSAMWEMIIAFVKAHPSAWHAIDMRKAVIPKLLTFLRYLHFFVAGSPLLKHLPHNSISMLIQWVTVDSICKMA